MIRKSTNLLLTRTLSNCLQNVIKRKNVGLTEVGHSFEAIHFQGKVTKRGFGLLEVLTAPLEMLVWNIIIE